MLATATDDETTATEWDQSYLSAVEDYKKNELTNEVDMQFMDMVLAAAGEGKRTTTTIRIKLHLFIVIQFYAHDAYFISCLL